MRKNLIMVFLGVMIWSAISMADEARLMRFPDVSRDFVAFVYGGDVYIAPRTGGQATRLTSHDGLELFPRFSPDGNQIAFTGQYDGDMSVYVMPLTGGEPKRLTYHPGIQNTSERFGPENVVMGWHPDGEKVLFRSRNESNDWWDGRAFLVDVEGGLPQPLPMAVAGFTSFSPDANKVAYCPIYRDFRTWKRYKGGMAQDVWIFDLKNNDAQKITDWIGTDNLPMWYRDKIYFNSDRTGILNLYCYELGSKSIRQVTTFTDYDVRWPSLGADGIAFENAGFVYVMDLPSEKVQKIEITLASDRHNIRTEYAKVSDNINDMDISPDGKRVVFSARGELFTVPAKEGNTRNLINSSSSNERDPVWSPDGKWIAYISDKTGEEEIFIISHDGKDNIRLTTDGHCHRYAPIWSPDSKKLIFSDKNLEFYYLDIDSKALVQIDKAKRNEIRDFSWSLDSKYIAYTKTDENNISAIFIYSFVDKKIHQVTAALTNDYSPLFDPEGKYLYFLSQRNFNPILSEYEFSFANQATTNLFLTVLSASDKSPFAPASDEVVVKEEKENEKDKKKEKDKDKSKDEDAKVAEPVEVKIDFDGIFDRQVAFDLPAGNYGGLAAIKGAIFYGSYPIYGLEGKVSHDENTLYKYDLKEKKNSEYASGVERYALSFDEKTLLVRKGKEYYLAETSGEKANLEKKLDISKMEARIDRQAEYRQMFGEVWRMERDFFYDENMHGVDWQKEWKKYEPLIPYINHRYDLTYVLGEMVGDLCCSHTYIGGGDYQKISSSKIGLLGVDFAVDEKNNRIRIKRILKGENWDEGLRSPLLEPGINVHEGDYLLAINGKEITADVNPYSLTENTVGKTITLTISDKPDIKKAREITVKPISSEETLRYYNWVNDRLRKVDSISGGEIGYIHIPDMDGYGLVRFAKMFYHQLRKPGLIIDVRYNGGGFVSGLILERLRRQVVAMGSSRNFAEGREPGEGINAHMITLLNEFSCSDGDYFPYFFREYKLGPLMGKRSWGGVIGIRGYRPLVDGGYYTAPEFSIYNLEGKWVMENEGVTPDMVVENPPPRMAAGYDDQLDAAIDYISQKLKEDPKKLPLKPGPPAER